ncbi:NACHT domain-containing protein [Dyadobacter aurulentus]|uniref:hypothetical protein n=1 Tax=Dyadobacter sp. UC 10 TaxID=2605428 RepID=UPI0011F3F691|nr:hypothetical protein [Dyadobacter sp. UC 10]KAA0990904.1 hypothetical protein FXO21_12450 [Dyadobacter sp. UC 10]
MSALYLEILQLRDVQNDVERGYRFEQAIREIQPWDRKPPVTASLASEQLDGIFLWKEQAYLIESKAKKAPITPGSHDWEDFELKIRRRKANVVGLFCSLFPVSKKVFIQAEQLNRDGHFVIILAGTFWEELNYYKLPIYDILDYMNLFGRTKFLTSPPPINVVVEWFYDKDRTQKKLSDLCKRNSSTFLRRFKASSHEALYLRREIDAKIESYAHNLKPQVIKKASDASAQICLVRDYSGSGKTTLSINVSESKEGFLGTGVAANEQDIDEKFANFFQSMGQHFGLLEIISLNKPVVFVVDSLDEANQDVPRKRREILSIFKCIEDLNHYARSFDLIIFPILIIFTIREDYWRDWESVFEGRKRHDINKRISSFTATESTKAIDRYGQWFNFRITNELTSEAKQLLSTPINLLIFSETNHYQGDIEVFEIWEGKVIDLYFTRKAEDIYKRHIQGLTSNVFMRLISLLAFRVVADKINQLNIGNINSIISSNFPILEPYSEEIIHSVASEMILIRDPDKPEIFRFRHSRLIEFLLAYYIVSTLDKEKDLSKLDNFAQISFDSGIVIMFRIHDDIRYICEKKFPILLKQIDDYYSKSNIFMSRKILRLRSDLATNRPTERSDIYLILKNINSNDPEVVEDAFFIIAARSNNQTKATILNLFVSAFNKSNNFHTRYKLIAKLEYHELLLNELVFSTITISSLAKDWEVYLGLIYSNNLKSHFSDMWMQSDTKKSFELIIAKSPGDDWNQVNKLLNAILTDSNFILGDA